MSDNVNRILEWQRKLREQPKIWAVAVTYEGEYNICDLYDSPEAAKAHAEWLNTRKPRIGRASVTSFHVQNEQLMRERFYPERGIR